MSDSKAPDESSSPEESQSVSSADGSASLTEEVTPRRGMLIQAVTAVLSFLLMAIPGSLAGLFYLDPILRKKKSGSGGGSSGALDGFILLSVTRDVVPEDGTPLAVTVKATLDDAWNRFKNVPVGSIWLRKQPSGDIIAFNSVCPHLGCSVNYRSSENDFFCPCHTSSFDLDGAKTNEVPPRNMDDLEIKFGTDGQEAAEGQELWLKFQNFRGATEEKIPV